MTDGDGREYALLEMDGGVGHAPAQAGRAEAAALAAQRYELRVAAATADKMKAARFQTPALQVLLELLNDELR